MLSLTKVFVFVNRKNTAITRVCKKYIIDLKRRRLTANTEATHSIQYDTIKNAILTRAQKLTRKQLSLARNQKRNKTKNLNHKNEDQRRIGSNRVR